MFKHDVAFLATTGQVHRPVCPVVDNDFKRFEFGLRTQDLPGPGGSCIIHGIIGLAFQLEFCKIEPNLFRASELKTRVGVENYKW